MDSMGPKNRLLREHELITREEQEQEDEQFGEDPFGEDPFEAELRNIDQGNLQIDTANQCSEESELLNGLEYLSHARLMELTGVKDLAEVTFFEAQVDSESTSMSDLGNMLPQLTQLKLSHSNIASLRDLGTCLKHLRVLWLNRSGLLSLDGLGSISGTIEELYIAFNHVTDLSPIADDDFEMLRILDCDSNEIDDPEQIEFLSGCKALHALTLENNPVFSAAGYVSIVTDNLPNLQILDDLPVDGDRPAREVSDIDGPLDLVACCVEFRKFGLISEHLSLFMVYVFVCIRTMSHALNCVLCVLSCILCAVCAEDSRCTVRCSLWKARRANSSLKSTL